MARRLFYSRNLGIQFSEFTFLLFFSGFGAALLLPYYWDKTLWIFFGLSFFLFITGHMCLTANRYIIIPGLISFVACFQWVVAPILAYFFPPPLPVFSMSVSVSEYLSFAIPATVALWIGLHLSLKVDASGSSASLFSAELSRQERSMIDGMILFAILFNMFYHRLPFRQLYFLYFMVAQLRFVGAFTLMFSRSKGWPFRMGIVFLDLILQTASGGFFYSFILWSGYLFISLAFLNKWRWRLVVYLALAFVILGGINSIKRDFRATLLEREYTSGLQGLSFIGDFLTRRPSDIQYYVEPIDMKSIGNQLVRFNQGWIISKVMATVPSMQPYAMGDTIVSSVLASLVPRVLLPHKIGAVSENLFAVYTGLSVGSETMMALSVIGEMYANFGKVGGVLAIFVYGWLIGIIFSIFLKHARKNLLWWAWVPFVLLVTIEAEWNLVDVLNHITKSLLVMWAFIYWFPVYKNRLIENKN